MQENIKKELLRLKVNVDKGIENFGEEYEEQLRRFINGYDFMRLGQAVNSGRFESAAMCVRRMSIEAEKLGLECFQRQFTGLRQNIARKDGLEVKNILSLVIVKRIQIQDVLKTN
ncbi:MAG: hypothetical protein IKK33_17150 [Lachnospiraceae bacterium]|nr:hypothetical protein [Lachnospiraceae bacterium]